MCDIRQTTAYLAAWAYFYTHCPSIMSCMIQVTQMEIWVDFSLVPRRSLLIRCPREVWERVSLGEYLSVTSQLMVAGPGRTEPKTPGNLGWVELCSSWNPFLWNLTWSANSYPFSWTNFTKRSSPVLGLKVRHVLFSYSAIASWIVDLKASEVKISKTSKLMLKYLSLGIWGF